MTTTLAKVLREYASGTPTLAAGQWGHDLTTGRIHAMRRDGTTRDQFLPYTEISTRLLSGTADTLQMASGSGTLVDSILSQAGGLLIQTYGSNGPTLFSVQNTTSGTSSLAGVNLASNGGLGASLFLASSAYTDDTGCTSRLSIGTGSLGTGINFRGHNASDTVKTFFGSTYASGNLIHTISNKGLKLENIILNTDADGTVAGKSTSLTVTKNDGNTRQFYADKLVATLNPGGSNAATTLDLLHRDTVNTATTGMTVNLLNLKYGGSDRMRLASDGGLYLSSLTNGRVTFANSGKIGNSGMIWDDTNQRLGISLSADSSLSVGLDAVNQAVLTMVKTTGTTPSAPAANSAFRMYLINDKFVIQYKDGATTKYWYIDMASTSGTVNYTTTPP